MKGPFFQLSSKEGLVEDDFVNCRHQDIIDSANTDAQRILIIGKPRSGKTTLAKALCAKHELVHVNVDNWIAKLLLKIKDFEENPPEEEEEELEEGQEPKPKVPFFTELEENVKKYLFRGDGPNAFDIERIIMEQINSPEAKTKGYLLDLDSSKKNDETWTMRLRKSEMIGDSEFTNIIELICDDEEIRLRALHMRATEDN